MRWLGGNDREGHMEGRKNGGGERGLEGDWREGLERRREGWNV